MKRLLLAGIAGLMLSVPASLPAFAQPGRDNHDNRSDNDHRRGNNTWRDDRHDARWDASQHNGYYIGKTWHYGPPAAADYRRKGFQLAWHPWKKGDRLGYYRTHLTEVNYRDRHLKAPPRGYHYVQDDGGNVILAAIATGLIASVILNNG